MPTDDVTNLPRYRAEDLRAFMAGVLERLGASTGDAAATADALVHADLRGVDSHGINMFTHNRAYVPGLRDGSVNRRPNRRILHETPSTALLDNDLGLGAAGATAAMELAIQKAGAVGSGFVAVTNGRHYGMAAHYAMQALPHGMIGLTVCNSRPYVAPAGGGEAMLGTNPIALAAPAGKEPPFVLDMATSAVAVGKLILARRTGKRIPRTWAQDAQGRTTDDPSAPWEGGWLLPLGGLPETSGYKGYGLAAMVDSTRPWSRTWSRLASKSASRSQPRVKSEALINSSLSTPSGHLDGVAAVDRDADAGDEITGRAGQEDGRSGQVGRLAPAAGRRSCQDPLVQVRHVVSSGIGHVRLDPAG